MRTTGNIRAFSINFAKASEARKTQQSLQIPGNMFSTTFEPSAKEHSKNFADFLDFTRINLVNGKMSIKNAIIAHSEGELAVFVEPHTKISHKL